MHKTIFVAFIGAFGGVERLILSLSHFLHRREIPHTVVCFNDTIDLASYADWPVEVKELKPKRNSLAEAQALKGYFRELGDHACKQALLFDLKGAFYAGLANLEGYALHLTDPPSLLATESSRSSAVYRRWAGEDAAPSMARRGVGEVVQRVNRRGACRAKSVIAMTERISSELEALYGVKAKIVRPGVAGMDGGVASIPGGPTKGRRILSVSRLETSKRLDEVIKVLGGLNSDSDGENGSWFLDVAGAGPEREQLKALTCSLGVSEQVSFHGRVSDAELENLYRQAEIFVMPAVQGYGLPALEALHRGVPVVMHRDSGASEIFCATPWVEIIDCCDDLAPALKRLNARIGEGELTEGLFPAVPTDKGWAEEISRLCGWLR